MIDYIIIGGYLLLSLVYGLYKGRHVTTMKEFAIGSHDYPTPVMVATIVATAIGGGSTVGIAEKVFVSGIVYIFIFMGEPVNNLIMAYYISPRMQRFRGMFSVGEIMGSFYGKPGRVITGVAGLLLSVGYVGAQVSAMGYAFNHLLDVPYAWGVIIGCGVVVIYSTFGGIRSVTATDVVQFAVLIIAIPMVCNVGLNLLGGYLGLYEAVPAERFYLFPEGENPWKYIWYFVIFSVPFLNPAVTQRLLMAKNPAQLKQSMQIAALIGIPFFTIAGLIGLIALALNPTLDEHVALPYLINTILPVGIKGLCVAGMFAVIMSTADSFLNVASIALVHDVVGPLKKHSLKDATELLLARITTFIIGVFAIVAALTYRSIFDLVLVAFNMWGPVVLVPLLSGIFGVRASSRAFVASVMIGLTTLWVWLYLDVEAVLGFEAFIPSVLTNGLTFYAVRAYEKRKNLAASVGVKN